MSTDNVIVFVCIGDGNFNVELLELAIRSLREKSSYKNDIVVFCDFDRKISNENDLNITRVRVPTDVDPIPHNFRVYMDRYYDFTQHKKVLYLDFDILSLKNINRLFSEIKCNDVYFTYAPLFDWTDEAFNTSSYIADHRQSDIVKGSATGICSGVFGIKTQILPRLLKLWREALDRTPSRNDQHALNEIIVKGRMPARPFPNEWVAYPLQATERTPDRRTFTGKPNYILYHFNPYDNGTKYAAMLEHMKTR